MGLKLCLLYYYYRSVKVLGIGILEAKHQVRNHPYVTSDFMVDKYVELNLIISDAVMAYGQ